MPRESAPPPCSDSSSPWKSFTSIHRRAPPLARLFGQRGAHLQNTSPSRRAALPRSACAGCALGVEAVADRRGVDVDAVLPIVLDNDHPLLHRCDFLDKVVKSA